MVFYEKDDVSVSLVQEEDMGAVINIFSSFDFNVNPYTSLSLSKYAFKEIMQNELNKNKHENVVLVLKIAGEVVGYLSCFVEFDRLVIGHIAVSLDYQHCGYGKLLTSVALALGAASKRDVSCVCYYYNNYLLELGFKKINDVSYLFPKGTDDGVVDDIFISIEDYRAKAKRELEENRRLLRNNRL